MMFIYMEYHDSISLRTFDFEEKKKNFIEIITFNFMKKVNKKPLKHKMSITRSYLQAKIVAVKMI